MVLDVEIMWWMSMAALCPPRSYSLASSISDGSCWKEVRLDIPHSTVTLCDPGPDNIEVTMSTEPPRVSRRQGCEPGPVWGSLPHASICSLLDCCQGQHGPFRIAFFLLCTSFTAESWPRSSWHPTLNVLEKEKKKARRVVMWLLKGGVGWTFTERLEQYSMPGCRVEHTGDRITFKYYILRFSGKRKEI